MRHPAGVRRWRSVTCAPAIAMALISNVASSQRTPRPAVPPYYSQRWSGDTLWSINDSTKFVVRDVVRRGRPDTLWHATFREGKPVLSEIWVFHGDSAPEVVGRGRVTGVQAIVMRASLKLHTSQWLIDQVSSPHSNDLLPPPRPLSARRPP